MFHTTTLFTCVLTCDTFGALRTHARDRISFANLRELTSHLLRAFVAAHRVAILHPCTWVTCVLGSGLGDFESLLACAAPRCHHHILHHDTMLRHMWGRTRLQSSRRMERGRGKPTPQHYNAMGRRDDTGLRSTHVFRTRMGWPMLLSS